MSMVFLLFMGVVIGFPAFPIARKIGWSYGRFGRGRDMALVIAATIIGGLLFIAVSGAVGAAIDENTGALVGGFIGAMIAVVVLVIFSLKAATDEPDAGNEMPR